MRQWILKVEFSSVVHCEDSRGLILVCLFGIDGAGFLCEICKGELLILVTHRIRKGSYVCLTVIGYSLTLRELPLSISRSYHLATKILLGKTDEHSLAVSTCVEMRE